MPLYSLELSIWIALVRGAWALWTVTICYNCFEPSRAAGVWGAASCRWFGGFGRGVVMIDTMSVRVDQHSATAKKGGAITACDVPAAASLAASTRAWALTVAPPLCS